jgi:hypothetical protein
MEDGDDMDVSLDGATSKRAVCMPVEDATRQTLTLYLSATLVERESACILRGKQDIH